MWRVARNDGEGAPLPVTQVTGWLQSPEIVRILKDLIRSKQDVHFPPWQMPSVPTASEGVTLFDHDGQGVHGAIWLSCPASLLGISG